MLNEKELKADFNKALDSFRENIQSNIETCELGQTCKNELEEMGKQVFYALSDFRDVIIKHLKTI